MVQISPFFMCSGKKSICKKEFYWLQLSANLGSIEKRAGVSVGAKKPMSLPLLFSSFAHRSFSEGGISLSHSHFIFLHNFLPAGVRNPLSFSFLFSRSHTLSRPEKFLSVFKFKFLRSQIVTSRLYLILQDSIIKLCRKKIYRLFLMK
jgi:hypothetical protein